ncbi:MAG: glycosyltransferase [Bacteroidales bacterium]|jgi:glycosyltransferase involved in cell wall biosynthesis|nr:glycosyltransferase [Bacteroidales bacterium]
MKVLLSVASMIGGGTARVAQQLCNRLSERNYDIYLAFDKNYNLDYDLSPQITQLHCPLFISKNKLSNLFHYFQTKRAIVKHVRPDVIIAFSGSHKAITILATLDMKIPIIASEHSMLRRSMSLYEKLDKYYFNKLAAATTVLTTDDIEVIGNRLKRKYLMPNPCTYNVLKEDRNERRKKNILCAGWLHCWHIKGFDNIIRIWSEIHSIFPDWILDFVGGDMNEGLDTLKQIAIENHCSDSINFIGFRKDIDKVMQESSIFCLCSRQEGFSLALLEAMSQGCACVAFELPGPRDMITNEVSGILVENQNLEVIGNALVRVMSDEGLRKRLSIGGKEEVKRFNVDVIVDKWEDLLKQVAYPLIHDESKQ